MVKQRVKDTVVNNIVALRYGNKSGAGSSKILLKQGQIAQLLGLSVTTVSRTLSRVQRSHNDEKNGDYKIVDGCYVRN